MMRALLRHRLIALSLLALLGGCASLTSEQCRRGDWYGVGLSDGRAGESYSRLGEHIRACREYGVSIDEAPYAAGRNEGLRDYCRLDNAFRTGLAGQRYNHVCPPEIDAAFNHYNSSAYTVYRLEKELHQVDARITDTELRLRASNLKDEHRRLLRMDLHDLDRHYDDLRDELRESRRYLEYLRTEAGLPPWP